MKLEFHPDAELELLESAFCYEIEVPGLGERLSAEVKRVTELLLSHPELGPAVDSERRQFVLSRLPFTIIYATTSDTLYVLAVAHQRRRPGYWRSRRSR
jgi:plasmid stabilization system protein ParE